MKKRGICLFGIVLILASFAYFVSAGSYTSSTEVTISTEGVSCVRSPTTASWEDSVGQKTIVFSETMIDGDCLLHASETVDACCPTGMTCNETTEGVGVCIVLEEEISYCAQFETQSECDPASTGISNSEVEFIVDKPHFCGSIYWINPSGKTCQNITRCRCEWESNECKPKYIKETNCEDGDSSGGGTKKCSWSTTIDNQCEDSGNYIVNYTASGSAKTAGDPDCKDNVRLYPCSSSVKLPFFTWFNFFSAMICIGVVYFFLKKN